MSTSTATAYEYNVAGHLSFGAPKCEKAQKSSGFWANRTYRLCIKDNVLIDPCMGSGHILVYAFDVFMDIYTAQGYTERDAAQRIVEKNLYGLELDDRATQLAYFAVMMKARSYDRRFLTRGIRPNLCSIQESNSLNTDYLELFGDLKPTAQKLVDEFIDAKEYGSILNIRITDDEIAELESKYAKIDGTIYDNLLDRTCQIGIRSLFAPLIRQAKIMVKKYNVVCTNPPYMGKSGMDTNLSIFIKKHYPNSKSDMSTVFMEKCLVYCSATGYVSMINIPVWMYLTISSISENNIQISKIDWDSFETSWDFKKHPFVINSLFVFGEDFEKTHCILLSDVYRAWESECNERFNQLKTNEEELNRIFIDIYGLQDELTPEVEDKDVTVRKADLQRDMRSFVSYAVGCMLGRYSLDTEGLAYAGGDWDSEKYKSFIPDEDNCIPITDTAYFEDDIVGRFCEFVKVVFGEDTLEANLEFVAKALGNKGNTSRGIIRNYFLNDFFKDHW